MIKGTFPSGRAYCTRLGSAVPRIIPSISDCLTIGKGLLLCDRCRAFINARVGSRDEKPLRMQLNELEN
jgi:hypothetical protein